MQATCLLGCFFVICMCLHRPPCPPCLEVLLNMKSYFLSLHAPCRYTSKVTLHSPVRIESRVDDSTLFHHLTNKWEFRPGPSPSTCWLSFDVDFAFKSPLYRQIASVFFEEVLSPETSLLQSPSWCTPLVLCTFI